MSTHVICFDFRLTLVGVCFTEVMLALLGNKNKLPQDNAYGGPNAVKRGM